MNNVTEMEAYLDCVIKIASVLESNNISNFKIGKTTQLLSERFNERYDQEYDDIEQVFESSDKGLIDRLEEKLIGNYKKTHPSKCDNQQIGGGPECKDSDTFLARIYIVYKKENK